MTYDLLYGYTMILPQIQTTGNSTMKSGMVNSYLLLLLVYVRICDISVGENIIYPVISARAYYFGKTKHDNARIRTVISKFAKDIYGLRPFWKI